VSIIQDTQDSPILVEAIRSQESELEILLKSFPSCDELQQLLPETSH